MKPVHYLGILAGSALACGIAVGMYYATSRPVSQRSDVAAGAQDYDQQVHSIYLDSLLMQAEADIKMRQSFVEADLYRRNIETELSLLMMQTQLEIDCARREAQTAIDIAWMRAELSTDKKRLRLK